MNVSRGPKNTTRRSTYLQSGGDDVTGLNAGTGGGDWDVDKETNRSAARALEIIIEIRVATTDRWISAVPHQSQQ